MSEPSTAQASKPPPPAVEPGAGPHETVWQRLQRHKVLQWTLAYAAAAYTVLHATQMVVESFEWPHLVVRVVALGLVVVLPVVVLLAWYHGHKAQHRISTGELSILTVLLLIAGTVMWGFTRARVPPEMAAAGIEPAASVAVVPFANSTGDPSKDYLSDGIAEELINALANVPGLKVPSRISSFAYKGHDTDVRRIARDLGVAKILEGSVQISGDRVRVTAELVDAQSGYHLWSQPYERKFADIFALQDELAKAIVERLLGKIGATSADSGISSPSTQNVEAYQLYMQARAVASVGAPVNQKRAVELLDQALALDPSYVGALSFRAGARASWVAFFGGPPGELPQAERDARRAEALRPNSGLTPLALIHDQLSRWAEAEREYQVAFATVDRTNPTAHDTYAIHLWGTGRLKAALVEANEAYRLAPAVLLSAGSAGLVNLALARDAEALKFADLQKELGDPTHSYDDVYGTVALRRGQIEEASARWASLLDEEERAAGGAEVVKLVVLATADPAKVPTARKALDAFARRVPRSGWLLRSYGLIGALDDAYAFVDRALDEHLRDRWIGSLPVVIWMPEMRSFRRDPRFQQLVTRLNLIDYWKQYGPPDDCDLHGAVLVCR